MNPAKLIRTGDDPILKVVCEPVAPGESIADLLDIMDRACKRSKLGVGLAAPQVGVAKRVILVRTSANGSIKWFAMVNPEILEMGSDVQVGKEGCLSYPGVWKMIPRYRYVSVIYENKNRVRKAINLYGFDARVFQHEYDHLQGICKVGDDSFPDAPKETARQGNPALAAAAMTAIALAVA